MFSVLLVIHGYTRARMCSTPILILNNLKSQQFPYT